MNFERMRALLLDQAIRGLLDERKSTDSVVAVVEGYLKREAYPFEVPDSWRWYPLGKILEYGKATQVSSDQISETTWVLDLEDIEKGTGRLATKKRGTPTTSNKAKFSKGDVLYGKLRPYLNKVVVADEVGVCTTEIVPINVKTAKVALSAEYLKSYLMSPFFLDYANKISYGVKMPRLGTKDAKAALIPVPPIEEQERIVAKLEWAFAEIDRARKAYEELQALAGVLRGQILQGAIQGKLVPQLAEEGVVEQIGATPKEVPFEIPESWKWMLFKQTCSSLDGKRIPLKKDDRAKLEKRYPYYGATGVIDFVDDYIFDGVFLLIGEDGANLLSRSKDNAFIASGKIWVNNHAHIFEENGVADLRYLALMINATSLSPYVTGSAQPKLTQKNLYSIPVPIPPIQEQVRIVAKVEELLNQVDAMATR